MFNIFIFIAFAPSFALCLYTDFLQFADLKDSDPLTPEQYQNKIKQGFSTNWFKSKDHPLSKYNDQNIQDVFDKGFRNLRLRARADNYVAPYNNKKFNDFLEDLSTVVDQCIAVGVAPIISWIHHKDEANATPEAQKRYVKWWTKVAKRLKDKNYLLSFNLFTELGIDLCSKEMDTCDNSLRLNPDIYNQWTSAVIKAIRKTGGKNENRILILGSPAKTAKDLNLIDDDFFKNDDHLMVEWHIYASGPNKRPGGLKFWKGTGNDFGRKNVKKAIKQATDFTSKTGIKTYLGAWMPRDLENYGTSGNYSLNENEVIAFGTYFAAKLKKNKIPWSLNVLDDYYDTEESYWIEGEQTKGSQELDMAKVLAEIIKVM